MLDGEAAVCYAAAVCCLKFVVRVAEGPNDEAALTVLRVLQIIDMQNTSLLFFNPEILHLGNQNGCDMVFDKMVIN